MKVDLVASTQFHHPDAFHMDWADTLDSDSTTTEDLIEAAGRACYQSWNRPNPNTAKNSDYIKHILEVGHESVLEHASATFYIQGVSRALTHELIRHRHLSFSQMSQRFVDESNSRSVLPPAVRYTHDLSALDVDEHHLESVRRYRSIVQQLTAHGLTRKQAREAARAVLPNATETKIVVTGNFRAWRDVIKKRNRPEADAEIQLLAQEILAQLKGIAPSVFGDL